VRQAVRNRGPKPLLPGFDRNAWSSVEPLPPHVRKAVFGHRGPGARDRRHLQRTEGMTVDAGIPGRSIISKPSRIYTANRYEDQRPGLSQTRSARVCGCHVQYSINESPSAPRSREIWESGGDLCAGHDSRARAGSRSGSRPSRFLLRDLQPPAQVVQAITNKIAPGSSSGDGTATRRRCAAQAEQFTPALNTRSSRSVTSAVLRRCYASSKSSNNS